MAKQADSSKTIDFSFDATESLFPYPVMGNKFSIVVIGVGELRAKSVSSFDDSSTILEYREGHEELSTRKFSGVRNLSTITIEKGMTPNFAQFVDWRRKVIDQGSEEAAATVTMSVSRPDGTIIRSYVFEKAWPSSISYGALDASTNDILMESIILQYSSFKVKVEKVE